jgi:hypothetical protein
MKCCEEEPGSQAGENTPAYFAAIVSCKEKKFSAILIFQACLISSIVARASTIYLGSSSYFLMLCKPEKACHGQTL